MEIIEAGIIRGLTEEVHSRANVIGIDARLERSRLIFADAGV
jgi:hypothetical protein